MNPITAYFEARESMRLLKEFEAESPTLSGCVRELIDLVNAQHRIIDAAGLAGNSTTQVTYLVAYTFCHAQYHNGEQVNVSRANAVVHVPGGIRTAERVREVGAFIKQSDLQEYINPKVSIQGIFELSRCKIQNTEVESPSGR